MAKRFFLERLAGLEERSRPGRPRTFPPDLVVQVKAWACELPTTHDLPLSRWSTTDLAREVCQSGLVASISGSTLWRWLHQDAIRLGTTVAGSFRAIPTLPTKPVAFRTSTPVYGRERHCRMMSS